MSLSQRDLLHNKISGSDAIFKRDDLYCADQNCLHIGLNKETFLNSQRMLELPNYSSQLMQQLWALRKGGHFCDCTVLVGDSRHRAHKLLLAASSMLFRSLLATADTISIDTAVVSSQEFSCLLDMIYTGKLPVGKHNVSRIIAAADNLQMFDVAIGFKKVLNTIVNPQSAPTKDSAQELSQDETQKDSTSAQEPSLQSTESVKESLSTNENMPPLKKKQKKELQTQSGTDCTDEPAHKGTAQKESSGFIKSLQEETGVETATNEQPDTTVFKVLKQSLVIVELFNKLPDVRDLLRQAAEHSLDQQDQQVVITCCDQADPDKVGELLLSHVKKGVLSEHAFISLLRAVHTNNPTLSSQLQSVLEELESDKAEQNDPKESTQKVSEAENTKEEEKGTEEISDGEVTEDSDYYEDKKTSSKKNMCRFCKKTFDFKCRLRVHKKRCPMSINKSMLKCPLCPEKFPNKNALKRHHNTVHKKSKAKRLECKHCDRKFAHHSGLTYHIRSEHLDEKPFSCTECGANFSAKQSLETHVRLHTGERPFACKDCDMSFTAAAGLAYHVKKKHSQGNMYVCQYCKAEFAQSIELTRHVRTHTGDRPYVCRECGKGFSQTSQLTVHLESAHAIRETYDCVKCSLSFSARFELNSHIQEIHPDEFYKCPACEKVFPNVTLLNRHKNTHTGLKLFSCDLCSKSYQQLSGLWYHNRTQHAEVFNSSSRQLKTLVQCNVCFKFFPSMETLAQHQADEHQGSSCSSLKCPFCDSVLAGTDWMQDHINEHHAEQSKTMCMMCFVLCGSISALRDHIRAQHPETLEEHRTIPTEVLAAVEPQETTDDAEQTMATEVLLQASLSGATDFAVSEAQSSLEKSQQVFVALADGQEGAQVVEMSMFDLLNNSVTFICEEGAPGPSTQT